VANKNIKRRSPLESRFSTYFKAFLLIGVGGIGALFVYQTNDVIQDIQKDQARMASTYTKIWQLVASDTTSGPVTSVLFDEIILKSNFPIVVTDSADRPLFWKELQGVDGTSKDPEAVAKVEKMLDGMRQRKGELPIYIDSLVIYKLYYDDPVLVHKLRLIPIIELAIVGSFILTALFGFQYIRRSEQRNIWVGMARETAHQLGTPISSLLGWLDLLREGKESNSFSRDEVYERIEGDLNRLQKVANRFGKIGSAPGLKRENINDIIGEVVDYFSTRLPHHGAGVKLEYFPGDTSEVLVDRELFSWVIENLLKNALEAVDSKTGVITVKTFRGASSKYVTVEVADNGRGIPSRDSRRIFKPGYTTKKRGWGLGLSLARRIVRDYHGGKIYLARSGEEAGSTFVITLPVGK
jgi:signal transduction histidine kinase